MDGRPRTPPALVTVVVAVLVAAAAIVLPTASARRSAEPDGPPVLSARATPAKGPVRRLHSRDLAVPKIEVGRRTERTAPGLVLGNVRTPREGLRMGPVIFDEHGRVRWLHRIAASRASVNLQVQRYRGRDVLTWGQRPPEGQRATAHSTYVVIADSRYRTIKRMRIRSREGRTDLHDFVITPHNTALMLGLRYVRRNLRAVGGRRNGVVTEGIVQEIDIETGRVLLDWRSLRRVTMRDSVIRPEPGASFDYLHLNSVSEDSDGNLLLSARHTNAVYKIHRRTGRVMWRLGGKRSSFRMGTGTVFRYQHDAQRLSDGTIQVMDNAATEFDRRAKRSRVLRLRLRGRTATAAAEFVHPEGLLALAQANARVLPNGNVFVGWGTVPRFSEFGPDGELVWDARLPGRAYQSYRGFKSPWKGTPPTAPAIVVGRGGNGSTLVFASWNGATEVQRWRVLAGPDEKSLEPVGVAFWAGLETRITVPGRPAFVAVEALGPRDRVLRRSEPVAGVR